MSETLGIWTIKSLLAQVLIMIKDALTDAAIGPVVQVPTGPPLMSLKQVTAENLAWHDHHVPFHARALNKQDRQLECQAIIRDDMCAKKVSEPSKDVEQ